MNVLVGINIFSKLPLSFQKIGLLELAKLKYTVPQKVLCMVYNSLVLPYLSYCNLVWACNSANKLTPIIVLQKRAVWIILKAEPCAHSSPLLKKLDLLKVTDICCFQTALFMFKFLQSQLPCKFNDYFSHASSVHHYTRNSTVAFMLPFCRTSKGKKVYVTKVLLYGINCRLT